MACVAGEEGTHVGRHPPRSPSHRHGKSFPQVGTAGASRCHRCPEARRLKRRSVQAVVWLSNHGQHLSRVCRSPLWQILSEIYHKKAHKEQEAAAANNSINVNIASDKKKGSCC